MGHHTGTFESGRHKENPKHTSGLVLTESGELCHFPFHYARMQHHTCISKGKNGPRPWCSLTRNFNIDKSWSYCVEGHKVTDHCKNNPCESRGVCENTLRGYHCECYEPYTGKNCRKDKCYDEKLQEYFEPKEKWLRYTPPILEECNCHEHRKVCKKTTGKQCARNPCLNRGHCIQHKDDRVCGCAQGFSGKHCEINHKETCYKGNGTSYRGTANVTVSGTTCLNWESDIIEHEVSRYSGKHAERNGLGPHSYCRNPDGDTQPWCFTMKEERVSWDHCLLPPCNQLPASTLPPRTSKPKPTTQHVPSVNISGTPGTSEAPKNLTRIIPTDCGITFRKSPSITPRIVGGLVALPASHPYMAAIYIGDSFCGGTVISSCWVLTAAHCLDRRPSVKDVTVVLGQSLFNISDQRTVRFPVQKYILHEAYSDDTFQHDIALVKLQDVKGVCAQFSQFVQPACLPKNNKSASGAQHCEVIGWGYQYQGAEHYAVFLQEAHVPIIPNSECQSPIVHGNKILPGMMCAGFLEGGVDACQGDSGGPLVCEVDNKENVFGIVSWGSGCAVENKPGVYTDVYTYINWILANIS
ncbi:coagulation factor XII isoform X1 [Hyla sarda]|uniref:coagulation factor XII isoform X1 n=2 Tax=Hyla sarda TaxID=327740 RepID=UPI0024C2B4FC|nr:coagulation factor XII isoform X1 [Hyla sarda]